jgi:hypothetical protein
LSLRTGFISSERQKAANDKQKYDTSFYRCDQKDFLMKLELCLIVVGTHEEETQNQIMEIVFLRNSFLSLKGRGKALFCQRFA